MLHLPEGLSLAIFTFPEEYLRGSVQNQGSEDISEKSLDEFNSALRKMKNKGDDGVVTEAIKIGGPVLMSTIQRLFNLCLWNQITPTK